MQTLRVVNKSLEGQPEYAVLQNIETNQIYEFSQINGDNIQDGDINHTTIQAILGRGHQIEAIVENDRITLHF